MRLIGKWRALVEGDSGHFRIFPWNRSGLDYLLSRMFAGEEVDAGALEQYGITVRPLADEDEVIRVPPPAPE